MPYIYELKSLRGIYSLENSHVRWGQGRILLKDWQMLLWELQMERLYGGIHKVKD